MTIIRLARHGQGSFGAGDYDRLSKIGGEQSRRLGAALRHRASIPVRIISGGLRRHRETAAGVLAGLETSVPVDIDDGWDEFDHQRVLAAYEPRYRSSLRMKADLARTLKPTKAFQRVFEAATEHWMRDTGAGDYPEPFAAFVQRVEMALSRAEMSAAAGDLLIVTSGGPIAALVSRLLAGDSSVWPQCNRITVNTGVTKLVHGNQGTTLVSFNEHSHLEQDQRLITYR